MEQFNRNWNEWNGIGIIFALHSQNIFSKNDNYKHHISCPKLKDLYGLHLEHTIFFRDYMSELDREAKTRYLKGKPVINLYPVYDGSYKETLEKEKNLLNKKKSFDY